MRILYVGDIMGRPGRDVVTEVLPGLRKELSVDLVIAQAENVSHGKGISPKHMKQLQVAGVDFFSGGNHSLEKPASHSIFNDPDQPIIRPANMKGDLPGDGWRTIRTDAGDVLVASLLGTTFPGTLEIDNPLEAIDNILEREQAQETAATVVNFHGDLSSQKRMIGYYLDGRVTAAIGDHWHVASADASVLPKGTAHISDVGMCGSLHSSLGIDFKETIPAWKEGRRTKRDMHSERPYQFNAVLVRTKNGLAESIEHIYREE